MHTDAKIVQGVGSVYLFVATMYWSCTASVLHLYCTGLKAQALGTLQSFEQSHLTIHVLIEHS